MTFRQFVKRNDSDRNFRDISSELVRTYIFTDAKIVIDDPIALHVSKSGHYVADSSGVVTFLPYSPNGWIALRFLNHSDAASMNF